MNVKEVIQVYTSRVSDILKKNRKKLEAQLQKFIWDGTIKGEIPDYVNLNNTMDILDKFIMAYELAAQGLDVEDELAAKTHQEVKSRLHIDTYEEWKEIKIDIESKMNQLNLDELVRYLIKEYGVIGTGEIISKKPLSDKGIESEVKWIFYVAAVVLNRVVREEVR